MIPQYVMILSNIMAPYKVIGEILKRKLLKIEERQMYSELGLASTRNTK